jgi:archaellum component FlaG (FlaF/FlaG flagellin family)
MSKRHNKTLLIGLGLLGLGIALVITPLFFVLRSVHAGGPGDSGIVVQPMKMAKMTKMTTIQGLNRIVEIGSTAFILDAHNNTIAVDPNPYDVAIAPANTPKMSNGLKPGDLVVTNFGANQTGKTLVRFSAQGGPGHLFNTMPNSGTNGPADEAFNTSTGTLWVANMGANNIQVFAPNGQLQLTVKSPLFNHPWGQAFNHGLHNPKDGAVGAFFSTNATDATIDRIELIPSSGSTRFLVTQIGRLTKMGKQTFIAVKWVPTLWLQGKKYSDVLLALDTANNRVAAYPNASTSKMSTTNAGITVFKGKPLSTPGGLAINPINGDLLIVNGGDNNLIELNPSQGKVVGIRTLDNVPVDQKTGTGSALFGVTASTDAKGNLLVFFTDDNTNTLNALLAS